MKIIKNLKNLAKATDFFYSTEMLRYDDDNQYKTLTGGIVSLAIIITIIVGFANLILNTLDLNTFTISTETIKNLVPTASVIQISEQSPFRFAIQIWRQNVTDSKRYFDITFRLEYQNYGVINQTTYFQLEPCTKEFFKHYSDLLEGFQRLQSSSWLCPPINTTLHLEGKYSSSHYYQYIIQVSACRNETDPSRPCATYQQIEKYFQANQNFFYFDFFFSNTQINPNKKDYKQYYIEDQSYALFGSNLGSQTFLYFTDYTVQTDYSIWPFSKIQKDIGCYAQDLGINHPFETNINGTYITWNIAKATNSKAYTREVQKLSMIFSFMGGMIGAISAVLFVIKIYTNVAFEFSIAFQLFKKKQITSEKSIKSTKQQSNNAEQSNQAVKQKKQNRKQQSVLSLSMNFFTFIRFYLYRFFDFVGVKYDSPQMKYAQECKEEIVKQLDVKKLLKRIIFLQHCLTKILDDYHLDVLQIKKPETPQEIRGIRLKCESIVDHQFQADTNINQKSQSSGKQEENKQQNNAQSPSQMSFCKQRRSNNLKFSTIHIDKLKSDLNMKDEIIVMELDEIKEERTQKHQSTLRNSNLDGNSNSAANIHKRTKKRQSNLVQLLSKVEQGNQISNNIWNKLDKETKKRAIRCSNMGSKN